MNASLATTSNRRLSAPLRAGRLLAVLALGTVLAAGLSSCEVPVKPAAGLFDSWRGNDADGAHTFATDAAVGQVFAQTWSSGSKWIFVSCDGTAGATYCSWVNRVETTLTMRVSNASNEVTEATFTPLSSGITGRFVHAWRMGDSATAQQDATPAATFQLFSIEYQAKDHWLPQSCVPETGGTRCVWINGYGDAIITHYDTATKKVTDVAFEDCGCTHDSSSARPKSRAATN